MEKPSPLVSCLQKVLPCYFKKQDFFGEGLTLHHSLITTRRNFKPYETMTEEEKKEKIQYLWHQTRRYFWQQVIMSRITKSSEANIQVTVIDEDEVYEQQRQQEEGDDPTEKWYLINPNKQIPAIWDFIIEAFTIYSLFATPFMYVTHAVMFF